MKKIIVTTEDLALLAEIRQRRGYHLACVLIEQIRDRKVGHVRYTRRHHFPSVEWLCDLIQQHFFGLQLHPETLAVALNDSGFVVELRRNGLFTDFTDEFLLQLRVDDGFKPGTNNRFLKHSDVLTPPASSAVH